MFFKLFLLVGLCSVLVTSKTIHKRDLPFSSLDDISINGELKKENKRDDDIAKKSISQDESLARIEITLPAEMIKKEALINLAMPKKRSASSAQEKNKSECCG